MKVEKEKRKVSIICVDGSSVRGLVHINPGLRVSDYLNDQREQFIIITGAEFYFVEDITSFKLSSKSLVKKDTIFLNKENIKWVEEIK